ncbi:putative TetR family transcriptional regulator [Gordonia effusa NBRC 100432]|uniref:Putative TetR family transcriptional regulator n=1 Tax=Gordonia effusa NBRC 100432 TaxID=1077974 RepID=H0QVJ6_9ACTN|nr:TetR/AcrR family transcriptional regulator [Gordonia effusa]GAB16873.1 putative TetR family transcriptional regulator [Gordonia effusa NBRC 100432]
MGLTADGHKERLLVALADAIRDKGLRDVQISDVVARAGASRRTFYRCFADKDAAVIALAERVFGQSVEYVASAIDPARPPADQCDSAIDAFFEYVAADPRLIYAIRTELPIIGVAGLRAQRDSVLEFATLLIDRLNLSESADPRIRRLRPDDPLPVMLISGLDGALTQAIERGTPIRELAPSAKALFRAALALG